jgi:hypothetical protein
LHSELIGTFLELNEIYQQMEGRFNFPIALKISQCICKYFFKKNIRIGIENSIQPKNSSNRLFYCKIYSQMNYQENCSSLKIYQKRIWFVLVCGEQNLIPFYVNFMSNQ